MQTDNNFTDAQLKTGIWVRDIVARSPHHWLAFYRSPAWRHKRKEILQSYHYECQRCKAHGKYSRATMVHHIKHLQDYPELALTDSNLMPLCFDCHKEMHPEQEQHWFKCKHSFTNEERF